jgi:uncharacterized protein YggT (Ycf19 family)
MTVWILFKSLFFPWHNEWLSTLLYLIFAIYFWVQLIFISTRQPNYDFNNDMDYFLMFIGTLGIAFSFTCTVIYLTFYPYSKAAYDNLMVMNF